MTKSDAWSQPSTACFPATEDKNQCRKSHKQAATEGGYSKALAGYLKGTETEHFGMSMGSRLQAFISEDKGISSKSVHINYVSLV